MNALVLLMFVSVVLLACAMLMFFRGVIRGDLDDGDRMSLLPLELDQKQTSGTEKIDGEEFTR